MPQAAYSLATVILHKQLAGRWSPENQWVTNTLRYIAVSLKELHDEELVHGDVKLKNFVRVRETVKAIDFDAATEVGEQIGHKFSSGYCPPEARLTDEEEVALKADPSFDVWSFGVLAYKLLTGLDLFKLDDQDNLEDEEELAQLRDWPGFETPRLKSKLKKVLATKRSSCPLEMRDAVTDLLRRCLCCEPSYRLEMQEVLEHKLLAQMAWPREVKQRRQLPLPPDGKSHFFVSKHERYKHLAMDMCKGLTEDG